MFSLCKHLNLSQFTMQKVKVKPEWSNDGAFGI